MTHPTELPPILDPASGSRMFYFDKSDDRVLFGDIRSEQHMLCDGRALDVNPDALMDFRALPFESDTFQVVIFDPPHLARAGTKGWQAKKYGVLDRSTWRDDLTAGFSECFRVLKPGGVLIFKWNETQIPRLPDPRANPSAAPRRTPVGKQMNTHWITFIKENRA